MSRDVADHRQQDCGPAVDSEGFADHVVAHLDAERRDAVRLGMAVERRFELATRIALVVAEDEVQLRQSASARSAARRSRSANSALSSRGVKLWTATIRAGRWRRTASATARWYGAWKRAMRSPRPRRCPPPHIRHSPDDQARVVRRTVDVDDQPRHRTEHRPRIQRHRQRPGQRAGADLDRDVAVEQRWSIPRWMSAGTASEL